MLVERVHSASALGALFPLIDVGSSLAAYVVFSFHEEEPPNYGT